MKAPRLRISWLMFVVAGLAMNFAMVRAFSHSRTHGQFNDLAIVGILPMLNILLACGVLARFRPRNRPFLKGFIAFGGLALSAYVLACWMYTDPLHRSVGIVAEILARPLLRPRFGLGPLIYVVASSVVMLPQLLTAWFGGVLSTKFEVVVVRRERDVTDEEADPT